MEGIIPLVGVDAMVEERRIVSNRKVDGATEWAAAVA